MSFCRSVYASLIVLQVSLSAPLQAGDSVASPSWDIIFQLDNDLFAGSDRDYTNGTRLAFIKEFARGGRAESMLDRYLDYLSGAQGSSSLNQFRMGADGELRYAKGWGITQLMFTPENSLAPTAPPGERPYAGWLGVEFSLHAKNRKSVSSVTLALGITGENTFAHETQDWIHNNISKSPEFQGWDSQVPTEFTVNWFFDHKRSMGNSMLRDYLLDIDGYYEWGGSLGNFRTGAYAGVLVRFGYNLPSAFTVPRVQIGSYGHDLFSEKSQNENPFSAYLFAGVRGSAVLHDITLDGPVFRRGNTGVKSEPFVGEIIGGFGLRYRDCELSFSRTYRSNEFRGQSENQEFGSIQFRANWYF